MDRNHPIGTSEMVDIKKLAHHLRGGVGYIFLENKEFFLAHLMCTG